MALLPRVTALAAALTFLITRYTTYSLTPPFATFPLFFCTLFLVYQLYSILIWPHYISTLRHLPQAPNAHWFWGQTKRVLAEPSGRPMRDWVENVPNQGLITYSVWFQQRVLITTPAALGEVLVTKNYDFVKPWHFRNGLGRILGIGVLLAEGEEHKIQRKNLAPAFAFGHLKRNIVPIFWSKAQELVECLANVSTAAVDKNHVSDTDNTNLENAAAEHVHGAVDVGNWTSRATLDIIGLSGMGQDFNALQNPDNKLHQTYKLIFNPGKAGRMLQVLAIFLPTWLTRNLPIKRNQELNAASAYIKQVCRDLIAKKRTVLAEKGVEDVDILSVALGSGGFQDHELVNQMMTFLIAGHETTATAMIWSLYLLCKHKSIQSTLRAEIRTRIPSLSSAITAAQIDSCEYLQAFCTEVLRLWPPVSLTLRVADRDTSIQGHVIPRGTTIILAPAAINTCSHLWGEDALEFRPERWLKSSKSRSQSQSQSQSESGNGNGNGNGNNGNNGNGEEGKRGGADSNYSFLTFLHGPRSCIGQKFSQYELACLLAAWVGRYDTSFEKSSPLAHGEPEIKGGITAKPKGGLWTTLEEVPGW